MKIMKIMKILYQIILIMMLIIMCDSCTCYARIVGPEASLYEGETSGESSESSSTVTGDESTGLPNIGPGYKPTVDLGDTGTSKDIIEKILGVLTVLGAISIVISIALIGFNSIMASASEKAVNQEKFVGLLIAAAVMTGGSTIAQMIIKFAESI